MPLERGARLGPYEIVGQLGAGGMGEVYRARDSRIGREVAIKVLPDAIALDKERLQRFEHEARAAGMLNHPNLLTIYEFGEANGHPFMVSELLEGETLRDALERGPVTQKKAVDYALQIARGLAAAHEKGIIHRDLKPENVFVLNDGRVKILDFGLAKLHAGFADQAGTAPATEPGMVLGTVGYMSPEQVRGQPLDQRSDIFSFGAILWEMLAGARAFSRPSSIETLNAILKEEPAELIAINQKISPVLEKLVNRCLEKKKEQRFQSARDLAFHLETMLTGDPSRPMMASPDHGDAMHGHDISTSTPTSRLPSLTGAAAPAAGHSRSVPAAHAGTSSQPRSATGMTHARPAYPPVRRTSPALLLVGALLLLIAGALAGYLASRKLVPGRVPSFQRLTFRRGEILSARFAPDGETIVYSAAWDGHEPEIYMMRRSSPESKPFGIPAGGDVAAISGSGEVAVLLNRNRTTGVGKLARVNLMGGQTRDVLDDVLFAEWMPDGQSLAVVHQVGASFRLEVPIGKVVLESQKRISSVRITRDGTRIAFAQPNKGQFEIVMMEIGKPGAEVLTTGWTYGINGLAWSPDGKSLWFTAAKSGNEPPALYEVRPGQLPKLASRLTGSLKIQDVSKDGRMLITHATWRASLAFCREIPASLAASVPATQPATQSTTQLATATATDAASVVPAAPATDTHGEVELAWLDWSMLDDVSRDGSMVLFSESREGGGTASSVYLRKSDGSAPVRLGDGWGDSLSPDGRWVLAHASRTKLVRIPTGSGEALPIKTVEAFGDGALWFPDGAHFLIGGAAKGGGYALYMQDVEGNDIKAITPEGIWTSQFRAYAISPDGGLVAGMSAEKRLTIYPIDGSRPRPVIGAEDEEIPVQWSADGGSLFVYRPTDLPARIYRIDLATGARALWKEIRPVDPAGVYRVSPVVIARDGSFWAYNTLRAPADLYVAEGLR